MRYLCEVTIDGGCHLLVGQVGMHVVDEAVDLLLDKLRKLNANTRSCQHDLQNAPAVV